jgi:hypothetical protein
MTTSEQHPMANETTCTLDAATSMWTCTAEVPLEDGEILHVTANDCTSEEEGRQGIDEMVAKHFSPEGQARMARVVANLAKFEASLGLPAGE